MSMQIIFLFVANPASQMPKSVSVLNCLINTHLTRRGRKTRMRLHIISRQRYNGFTARSLCQQKGVIIGKAKKSQRGGHSPSAKRRPLGVHRDGGLPGHRPAQIQILLRPNAERSQGKAPQISGGAGRGAGHGQALGILRMGGLLVRAAQGQHRAHHPGKLQVHPAHPEGAFHRPGAPGHQASGH